MDPVIKWSGSKRSQAQFIRSLIPEDYGTYYEPFVGGGSVLYAANPNKGVCGDICNPLINLWKRIQSNPDELAQSYETNWTRLQEEGYLVYYEIRDRFNDNPNPDDLLFLSRTCVNVLIRFNSEGKYNYSFHLTRKGINPNTLDKIIHDWSSRIQNVVFLEGDYHKTTSDLTKDDFVYLDPPYQNTKGRYYGTIDFEEFCEYLADLNSKGVRFILSYDGTRGDINYIKELPKSLYKRHMLIPSGYSTFRKIQDKKDEMVCESLYLNY